MLHAGLDLSRKKLDVCVLSDEGELVGEFPAPPDADGLRGLVRKVGAPRSSGQDFSKRMRALPLLQTHFIDGSAVSSSTPLHENPRDL